MRLRKAEKPLIIAEHLALGRDFVEQLDLAREHAETRVSGGSAHHLFQPVGRGLAIGIGKGGNRRPHAFDPAVTRDIGAGPRLFEQLDADVAPRDFARGIVRPIVDDDDLISLARQGLVRERFETAAEHRFPIPDRYDDCDFKHGFACLSAPASIQSASRPVRVNLMLHLRRRAAPLTGRPEPGCLRSQIIARYQGSRRAGRPFCTAQTPQWR